MSALWGWLWQLGPANPIVVRVVQGGSRRRRHLWLRMAYLGMLIGMMLMGLLVAGGGSGDLGEMAKGAARVFVIVSYGQVVLICLLAPLFMAGAIGDEQAGQTMDILLTTPLSNLQIVLGSLIGRLFFVLALTASGVPLFAVLMVVGGVPVEAVFVAMAVAALTAVVVGSVAIALAVARRSGKKAVYVFVIAVMAYLVGLYGVDRLVRSSGSLSVRLATASATGTAVTSGGGAWGASGGSSGGPSGGGGGGTTWLTALHPLLVLEASLNRVDYRPPSPDDLAGRSAWVRLYMGRPLAAFAVVSLLASGGLTVISAVRLRRVGQGPSSSRWARWLRRWLGLSSGAERRRPVRWVWANPVAWREASAHRHRVWSAMGRWGFAAVGVLIGGVVLAMYHRNALPQIGQAGQSQAAVLRQMIMTVLLIELLVIVLVAIYMSACSVSREREDGTLDLVLTTPITPKQYVWGKLRGLVSYLAVLLAAPVLTVGMIAVYTAVGLWLQWPQAKPQYLTGSGATANFPLMTLESPLLLVGMLVPFVALCVAVGMTWSVKAKGVLGAVVPAVGVIMCVTVVSGFCGYSAMTNIPLVGPVMNAFSPTTNLVMLLNPWQRVSGFADQPALGRLSVAGGAVIAAVVYGVVVHTLLGTIVRQFDHTVRRLSGTG